MLACRKYDQNKNESYFKIKFPEFSLVPLIFRQSSLSFLGFLFFSLIFQVFPDCWEPWVIGIQKCKKNQLFFSCTFELPLWIYESFEKLNFVFSSIIHRGVSTYKILTFEEDQYFQKYKAQKIVKFSLVAFLAFFLNCP